MSFQIKSNQIKSIIAILSDGQFDFFFFFGGGVIFSGYLSPPGRLKALKADGLNGMNFSEVTLKYPGGNVS